MTLETSLIDSALRNWQSNVDRAGKLFGNLTQEQLLQEVSPGKNRLIYLWGHLTAFNDALIPLLGFGPRIHGCRSMVLYLKRISRGSRIAIGSPFYSGERHISPYHLGQAKLWEGVQTSSIN